MQAMISSKMYSIITPTYLVFGWTHKHSKISKMVANAHNNFFVFVIFFQATSLIRPVTLWRFASQTRNNYWITFVTSKLVGTFFTCQFMDYPKTANELLLLRSPAIGITYKCARKAIAWHVLVFACVRNSHRVATQ
jgi:hypothetical protein